MVLYPDSNMSLIYNSYIIYLSDYHGVCSMSGGCPFAVSLQKDSSDWINLPNENSSNLPFCDICNVFPCCLYSKWS